MQIVIFGDSITQGFHDTKMGGWANRLATYLMHYEVASNFEEHYGLFNLGIAGDTSEDVLARLDNEARVRSSNKESLFIVAVGINDSNFDSTTNENRVTVDRYRDNLKNIISSGRKLNGRVIFVTLLPIMESMLTPIPWATHLSCLEESRREYDLVLREVANEQNCKVIDVSDCFPATVDYLPDGIHPNAEGHKLVFERILEGLKKEGIIPA